MPTVTGTYLQKRMILLYLPIAGEWAELQPPARSVYRLGHVTMEWQKPDDTSDSSRSSSSNEEGITCREKETGKQSMSKITGKNKRQ